MPCGIAVRRAQAMGTHEDILGALGVIPGAL